VRVNPLATHQCFADERRMSDILRNKTKRPAKALLLLAHGAGAGMDSAFLDAMSDLLGARKISCMRFEFAYMAARRADGKRRPPPRVDRLADEFKQAVRLAERRNRSALPLLIGGKSMGGRVASLVADELYATGHIAGLVCLGYPFHPPR
jgi:predicted alpha/beta-hydrolase family hydrolase